jgi:hypothetical protein
MNESQWLPQGWDETRINEVLSHYEKQNEDEQAEEIDEAWKAHETTMIAVPVELADEVLALIVRRRSA